MRVLVVKTSSLGDVIHTLPALSDAMAAVPGIEFDWVVEEGFREIPAWHPAVDRVIPIGLRRWRREPLRALRCGEIPRFLGALRERSYDTVIDAQGLLLKSALVCRLARGRRFGFDRHSAREPLASVFYDRSLWVPRDRHAVERVRDLFAQVIGYTRPFGFPDYGIAASAAPLSLERAGVVFLHGTTWPSKRWPESFWRELAGLVAGAGIGVLVPWGNESERRCASRICKGIDVARVLPRTDLAGLARTFAAARAVVGVDTGLCHLAAALSVPAITLYGATGPALTGTFGRGQWHLAARYPCAPCLRRRCTLSDSTPPCYQSLSPPRVWRDLSAMLGLEAAP